MMNTMRLVAVTLLAIFLCCACASQSGPPSVIYPDPVDVPLDERGVTR